MILPAAIDYWDPSVGKRPYSRIMTFAFRSLMIVIGTGPGAVLDRLAGKLMEALFNPNSEIGAPQWGNLIALMSHLRASNCNFGDFGKA